MEKIIGYIGSKVNLYSFLNENIFSKYDKKDKNYVFLDLFLGTSSVSNYIYKNTNWNIIGNDFSNYSKILFSFLYFKNYFTKEYISKIKTQIKELDNLEIITNGDIFNEFSQEGIPKTIEEKEYIKIFNNQRSNSRMFFSKKVGQKIDTIKEKIKNLYQSKEISEIQKDILMIFLINYADKNKNTTSVYGAYLKNEKKMEKEKPFLDEKLLNVFEELKNNYPNSNQKTGNLNKPKEIKSYSEDIINMINILKKDKKIISNKNKNIIYLDPPYSTRTYESNYHILDYIVDFNFNPLDSIKINSKTAQLKEKKNNPFSSKLKTYDIFSNMIKESLDISNNIYISYSTDGLIQQKDIEKIIYELNNKENQNQITLKTITKEYKRYKAAKTNIKKQKEELNRLEQTKIEFESKIKTNKLIKETEKKETAQLISKIIKRIALLKNEILEDKEKKDIPKKEHLLKEIIWEIKII